MNIKTHSQIIQFLSEQNHDWNIDNDGQLEIVLAFENYLQTFGQASQIALISEQMDHHPTLIIDYNKLAIKIKTHSENGITEKDFEFVKKVNQTLSTN
ncbi:MAG: 4a-hydroxytetrahydrobiopterin dehydratase [Flavobacteriaceae bacterium]|nr:4a-hydroxytetrahydrobiopterin dehydratase [Flavobacteriaceae bacterium]MCY4266488.1 4a-hydroxytetrahydrobiopterin dehydratase [Flavobacteriaceae bacterium]MCY4298413.1 4a-hydroxytetrahydrobiopterin dehydratase [Flavobacteriaceae bacterium]